MFPIGGFGLNIIIFGVDINFSVHVDNKKKDISIRSQGPTEEFNGTILTA